jgi:gliding motility-associated-like protein
MIRAQAMKRILRHILLVSLLAITSISIYSQEYWLGHGFTSGQTIITNSGTFYDDGKLDLYTFPINYNVTFCSENNNPITLDFNGFRTDYRGTTVKPTPDGAWLPYDYMTISYPGASWVAFDDDTPQFGFTSASGCMTIGFRSQTTSIPDSGWVAEISAVPPPANNDPCTAAVIPVGNSCSPSYFTNKGAYNTTTLGNSSCHRYFGGDVWFTATIPASGQLKLETFAGSLKYAIMVLYTGTCTSLTEKACIDNIGGMPSTIYTGTVGQKVYIRIYGDQAKSGTFGICATDPNSPITGFKGPGGVGDNISNDFWIRADKGMLNNSNSQALNNDAIKTLVDQSGNNLNFIQATANFQATYHTGSINGFPVLTFDGSNDYYSKNIGNKSAPIVVFAVGNFKISKDQTLFSMGNADNTNTTSLSREISNNFYYNYTKGVKYYGTAIPGNTPYIFHVNNNTVTPFHQLYYNTNAQTVTNYPSSINLTNGVTTIGTDKDLAKYFNGDLGELILYNKKINSAQRVIINNYLAAKYGISIGTNDKYGFESVHKYDVAGIGRVDASNIHSKAQSAGILAIGGASDLENGEYLFFGHDNGSISAWTNTEVPNADNNLQRIAREWRVDMSGGDGVGSVILSIQNDLLPAHDPAFLAYNILIDKDGDFSTGATAYGLIKSGDEWVSNPINISDSAYISLCVVKPYVQFETLTSQGLESANYPQFNVVLNYAISDILEVNYSITAGDATGGGVDYSLNPNKISFNPGEKIQKIIPTIVNDDIVESPDEYFEVSLSNPTAGVLLGTNATHTYTIIDDDIDVSISASETTIGECVESSTVLTASVAGKAPLSYSWTPTTGLDAPGSAITNASPTITTKYFLTVTDGIGNIAKDSILITVVPLPSKPIVSEGGSLKFCEGDSVTLTSEISNGYLWSSSDTTQAITIKTSGIFNVQTIDIYGCKSLPSDNDTIVVNPLPSKPVIDSSGNLSFCDGNTVILSAPDVPGYTYLWSGGETTKDITADASGTFTVQVTDGNSCDSPVSDSVVVTEFALPAKPEIDSSGNLSFCDGNTVVLSAPNVPGYTYLWSGGETTKDITADASGTFTVQVTDGNLCASPLSDPVVVTEFALPAKPEIDSSGNLSFCDGGSVILSAPASAGYLWSNGETTQNITVDADGTFTLVVSDGNSCPSPVSDPVVVNEFDIPSKPVIDSSGNLSFCDGGSVILSAPASAGYLWSNGETTQNITVDADGTFTLVVSDGNSCPSPVSDPVVVNEFDIPSKPVIDSSGNLSFCDGGSVILSAPASAGYLWSNGETTQDITIDANGTFTVQVSDGNSCLSPVSDAVTTILVLAPMKPSISYSGDLSLCEGENIVLTSSLGYEYEWSTGEITQNISVTSSGSYSVLVKNSTGCSSEVSDIVWVEVNPLPMKPVISPSGPVYILTGDSAYLSAGVAENYIWSTTETGSEIFAKSSGFYTVQVFSDHLCYSEVSDPVEIIVSDFLPKPSVILSGAEEFCEGASLDLSTDPADKYIWSNGETTQTITVDQSGTYTLVIENASGVQSLSSDPVVVTVHPNPELSFNYTDVSCYGGNDGTVTAIPSNGTSPYTFNWSNGGNQENLSGLAAATYNLTVIDNNSCSVSGTQVITQPSEMQVSASISPAKCAEASDGELLLSVSGATPPYSFEWNTGSFSDFISGLSPGNYTVTITDNNNCEVDKEFSVDYENELCFMIPDIITPNNDGRNDTWMLEGLQLYSGVEVEIYDRWGKRVFYSRGYDYDWDGTNNGKELPMESYHYIINLNNGTQPIIGNVTIVR